MIHVPFVEIGVSHDTCMIHVPYVEIGVSHDTRTICRDRGKS